MKTFRANDEIVYQDISEIEFVKVLEKSSGTEFISPKFYTKSGHFYNIFEPYEGLVAISGENYKELAKSSPQEFEKYAFDWIEDNNRDCYGDHYREDWMDLEEMDNFHIPPENQVFLDPKRKNFIKTKDSVVDLGEWYLKYCFEDYPKDLQQKLMGKVLEIIELCEAEEENGK